jgi:ssDNA-binding Zn-finger/Zn-ribbon topoisomerase 1
MIRLLARWWARWSFVWAKEVEGGKHEWAARVADRNAAMTRDIISRLTKEADDMDVRIKEVAEMEEKGFWMCENGHESEKAQPSETSTDNLCPECGAKVQLVKRSEMSGQEKYESDKDRTCRVPRIHRASPPSDTARRR